MFVFVWRKFTAQDWFYPQHAEKARGKFLAVEVLGRPGSREITVLRIVRRHLLERASAALPIEKVRVGDGDRMLQRKIVLPRHHQAFRLAVWQWCEKHALHHAEDGGIRADAEGEREDCDGGEAGGFS